MVVVDKQGNPVVDATVPDPTVPVTPTEINGFDTNGTYIIISAFAIAGGIGALAIMLPENALKVSAILTGIVGGIIGFIAGRKKI